MVRPLMQRGVGELEAMFAASRTDLKVLKQLQHELQFRQVPRALALLEEVQAAMARASNPASATSSPAPAKPPAQSGLWESSPDPKPQPVTPSIEEAGRPISRERLQQSAADDAGRVGASTMSLDDAYRLLKVTAGSAWEVIEESRRQLIQRSHPERLKSMNAERRDDVLADANSINAAYAVLSQARCFRS